MPTTRFPTHDPTDVIDYTFDYSRWLAPNDSIATSVWTVDSPLVVTVSSNTTTSTTAYIAGGAAGTLPNIANTITTAYGRTRKVTAVLPVAQNP